MHLLLGAKPLKALLVALLLIIVGAWCYLLGSNNAKQDFMAKQANVVIQSQSNAQAEVKASLEKSVALDKSLRTTTQFMDQISKQAVARVEATQPRSQNDCPAQVWSGIKLDTQGYNPWAFDNATVGLLNAARLNDPNHAAVVSDGQGEQPSTVTVSQLVENDLEVVKEYHVVAERHSSLVDYIQEKINDGYLFCKPST